MLLLERAPYSGLAGLKKLVYDVLIRTEWKNTEEQEIKRTLYALDVAYTLAKRKHAEQTRADGTRYFDHVASVTKIRLTELPNPSFKGVIMGLCHDLVEDTDITIETIRNLFGDEIANGVDALTKKEYEYYMEKDEKEVYNALDVTWKSDYTAYHKKRLAALRSEKYFAELRNAGVEVIMDKGADRLHNLRNLLNGKIEQIPKQIEETEQYFLPILSNWESSEDQATCDILSWLLQKEIAILKLYYEKQQYWQEIAWGMTVV